MRRRFLPLAWRIRVRAAARMADETLQSLDAYLAARLDTRTLRSVLCEAAQWASSTWRRHRDAARTAEYGPGRGLLAVIITRPTTPTEKEPRS